MINSGFLIEDNQVSENFSSGKIKNLLFFPKYVWIWFLKDFIWPLLLIPFLFVLLMSLVLDERLIETRVDGKWMIWDQTRRWKDLFEIAHPAILGLCVFLGFLGRTEYRKTTFTLLGGLCAFALLREIAGQGCSTVFFGGILLLIVYAHLKPEKLTLLYESRWTLSYVGMGFFCYALSLFLNIGLVKYLARPFTETEWPPYSSCIEESLESLGGFFLFLSIMSLFFLVGKGREQN